MRSLKSAILMCVALISAAAQQRVFTAADYARAEKFMGYNTTPLVLHSGGRVTWLADDRFWYRTTTADGTEFVLVDAARGASKPAFDHAKLASALSAAAKGKYNASHLPFMDFEFRDGGHSIAFNIRERSWICEPEASRCVPDPTRNQVFSPDKKNSVFIRDFNLWMRDADTGSETQLTSDGVKDFGYATDNAGWANSDRPVVLWSPDSKKIATFQQDQRGVGEMYLVSTKVGHPELRAWKYPLPGDEVVTTIQRVIIDLSSAPPRVIRLKMPADQHRSTLCDNLTCRGGEWADVQWSADGAHLAFVSTSRDHKEERLRVADAATGAIREVLDEKVATFFESGNGRVNWRYLPASSELIWFSERDNWGHLYLCDLETGKIKWQITNGDWNVTQLLRVDQQNRMLYFLGVGREKGRDPYFSLLYRIGFDGKNLSLLTPEDGNHEVAISPSGRFITDSYSKPDVPSVALLRDTERKLISTFEKADMSRLDAAGWKPPVSFTVKARDGVTDLYGLMFKPSTFDPNKKYPIVNHIYPGDRKSVV